MQQTLDGITFRLRLILYKEVIMDVILMLFGMSYFDNLQNKPPEQPQAIVYKVMSTEITPQDPNASMWDTNWINKKETHI